MMLQSLCCAALLASAPVTSASTSNHVTVRDGYMFNPDGTRGTFIGHKSSDLQTKVINVMYEKVGPSSWSDVSIVDDTVLRTLELHGDYVGDVPLHLPSLFRLRLQGTLSIQPGISTTTRFDALVVLNGSSYSAVLGGTYNAAGENGYSAVSLVSSTRCSVEGVTAMADTDVVCVNKGSLNEVTGNTLGPGKGRCIWTLATSRAMVHGNQLSGCLGHSLDFDAYTTDSVAYRNTVNGSNREGIFVEETASNNVIVGNVLMANPVGIGVYSNAVGPVKGNTFIGNVATENGAGFSAGGYGHDPKKHSEMNAFIANIINGNSDASNIHHGDTQGDVWMGNENKDGWAHDPQSNAAVAVVQFGHPLGTEHSVQRTPLPVIV